MADEEEADFEVLPGGVGNAGQVLRVGPHVLRPAGPHHPAVHALLVHLHRMAFDGAPELVGLEGDGRERLVFIPGQVAVLPFPAWSTADSVLASIAALMRRYHDATAGLVAGETAFVEMWDRMGGQARYDRCREWFAHNRDRFITELLR